MGSTVTGKASLIIVEWRLEFEDTTLEETLLESISKGGSIYNRLGRAPIDGEWFIFSLPNSSNRQLNFEDASIECGGNHVDGKHFDNIYKYQSSTSTFVSTGRNTLSLTYALNQKFIISPLNSRLIPGELSLPFDKDVSAMKFTRQPQTSGIQNMIMLCVMDDNPLMIDNRVGASFNSRTGANDIPLLTNNNNHIDFTSVWKVGGYSHDAITYNPDGPTDFESVVINFTKFMNYRPGMEIVLRFQSYSPDDIGGGTQHLTPSWVRFYNPDGSFNNNTKLVPERIVYTGARTRYTVLLQNPSFSSQEFFGVMTSSEPNSTRTFEVDGRHGAIFNWDANPVTFGFEDYNDYNYVDFLGTQSNPPLEMHRIIDKFGAKGTRSFAHGERVLASGENSQAFGKGTLAIMSNQLAVGEFNNPKEDTRFEVGIGNDENSRANGLEVNKDGSVVAPQCTIDETSNPKTLVPLDYLTEAISGATPNLDSVDHIDFDTTPLSTPYLAGRVKWDADKHTITIDLDNGSTLVVGQDDLWLVKNNTQSTIDKSVPVMFAGTNGNSGTVLIEPALSGMIDPNYTIGMTIAAIAPGAIGYVSSRGYLSGVNTTGTPEGEDWNDGDILYVSETSGKLTNIVPQAPHNNISMAVVIHAHTNGKLLIRPTWKDKFTDLSDVNGTPLTKSGQIPVWHDVEQYFDFTENITHRQAYHGVYHNGTSYEGNLEYNELTGEVTFTQPTTIFDATGKAYVFNTGVVHTIPIEQSGKWFVYMKSDGTIESSQTPWNQTVVSPITLVINKAGRLSKAFEERHKYNRNAQSTASDHSRFGTTVKSRPAITGYTLNGTTDAHNSYSLTSVIVQDEDISKATRVKLETDTIPQLYVDPSGYIDYEVATVHGYTVGTLYPKRQSSVSGDNLVEISPATQGSYFNQYIFTNTLLDEAYTYFTAPGYQQWDKTSSSDTTALDNALATVVGVDCPLLKALAEQELCPVFKLTYLVKASNLQTGKAKLVSIQEITGSRVQNTSGSITAHSHNISDVTNLQSSLDNKQPLDALLTAVSSLVTSADKLPYFTGTDTVAMTTLTAFIRTLLDDATAADACETLGAELTANKGALNGYASLVNGKVPDSQIPDIAITNTSVVSSQTAMLALTAQVGDVAVRTDLNKNFILRVAGASTLANWQELLTPTDTVTSVNGQTGNVSLNLLKYSSTQLVTNAATYSIADVGKLLIKTGVSSNSITLDAAGFADGDWIDVLCTGDGDLTVTVTNAGTLGVFKFDWVDGLNRLTYRQALNSILSSKMIGAIHTKTIIIETPTTADDITFFRTNDDITIQSVNAILTGSNTPSVTYYLYHGTNRSSLTTEVTHDTVTSTTTEDSATIVDATLDAGDWVNVDITGVSGTVTSIAIDVRFTVN